MDLIQAVLTRKSVRGYKAEPVSRDTITSILTIAQRATSPANVQPCEITVITGDVFDELKRANVEQLESGALPRNDLVLADYTGVYRKRQIDLALKLFGLLGIAREDRAGRLEWAKKGGRFFDAPVGIVISADESADHSSAVYSAGSLAETIALVALDHGLGTCIQEQVLMYPEAVRRVTGIPQSKRLLVGMAMGYPDWDFPPNQLRSERAAFEDVVTWCGFDEQ